MDTAYAASTEVCNLVAVTSGPYKVWLYPWQATLVYCVTGQAYSRLPLAR